jgi:exportin-2 (importin alpha re-exporter)
MIIAITARAATAQLGATKTNAAINVPEIFSGNILGDLQAPVTGKTPHPVLKVDALKFLSTFRHQLSKEQLSQVFPLVVSHLGSTNYVVHTYAAVCIERVLFMKTEDGRPLFSPEDLKPYTETLLTSLFRLIEAGQTPEKVSENDYLIKTVMRVIYIARQDMAPYARHILERLVAILQSISRNPSNPKFNHYVFESIGSLVRFLCTGQQMQLVTQFEELLFPPFQGILSADIPEFTPYVFQILAQLFEYHMEPGVPALYQPLLAPLLMPSLWESHGNVPALVRLLQAYLSHGGESIASSNQLPAFLGIFQKLIASRLNDHHGFDLLLSIFQHVPQ